MKTHLGRKEILTRFAPPVVGIVLAMLFVKLGFWQLDRASQKTDLQQAFDEPSRIAQVTPTIEPSQFQAIKSHGHYLSDQQIVIENIIVDGALGHYVVTPFEFSLHAPLLLVNRGWLAKSHQEAGLPNIEVDESTHSIRGKTGRLPRVGIRPGDAFLEHDEWPRSAVWPTADEVAQELDRDVLPFVLLLDPEQENGFVRHWKPKQRGPAINYGYAFQWFAMAVAVLAIMGWNYRKIKKAA